MTTSGDIAFDLTDEEVRVLGCLIEKEATTPAAYPLTLNSLRLACNQSTSREPVVDYGDHDVEQALRTLRERGLTRNVHSTSNRAMKYRHVVPEAIGLDEDEVAVIGVLMLRGPQTIGELKSRTERIHAFADLDAVASTLERLASADRPLAVELDRAPGQKESRWAHLLSGVPEPATAPPPPLRAAAAPPTSDRVELFLEGARAVASAIASREVAECWDRPSVLDEQLVGGLAGHLARGAVWAVGDYLDGDTPSGSPDVNGPAEYFVTLLGTVTDDDHRAIRERGAAVAAIGHSELCSVLADRIARLESQLASLVPEHLLTVAGGLVIRLDDYLATRIVEQVVHLDDLNRSTNAFTDAVRFPVPAAAQRLTIDLGIEILLLQRGLEAAVRAIFRDGFAESAFPVL